MTMLSKPHRRFKPITLTEQTTLRELLADVAAELDRRKRGLPEPLPDVLWQRWLATALERAADLRPILMHILAGGQHHGE
jgi:hypothetical protein